MILLAALAIGVLIGISLGALGGGGSILTVPALVYVLSEPARAATSASLVIVGITATVGAIGHARAGRVRWAAGTVFGLVGVAASFLGTAVNRAVNPDVLLLAFAGLMLLAAAAMLYRARGTVGIPTTAEVPGSEAVLGGGMRATAVESGVRPAPGSTVVRPTPARATGPGSRTSVSPPVSPGTAAKVVAAGLVVGFLTGFLGVGGGFVIVPALVMALGYPMPIAVGTSLLVIAINSAAALAARAGHETFHWAVIVPFTIAAMAGSLGGKQIADRVSGAILTRCFAGLLVTVAVYVALRSGLALG